MIFYFRISISICSSLLVVCTKSSLLSGLSIVAIATIQLPLDYEIGLNITPDAATVAAWTNIIHISANDNDCCDLGDRVPGKPLYVTVPMCGSEPRG